MAISLSKTFLQGQVTATYHRINTVPYLINITGNQSIFVCVDSYVNSDAYKINNLPALTTNNYPIIVSKEDLVASGKNIYAYIYSQLMTLPDFQGSTEI
jgi:hypothetical protein